MLFNPSLITCEDSYSDILINTSDYALKRVDGGGDTLATCEFYFLRVNENLVQHPIIYRLGYVHRNCCLHPTTSKKTKKYEVHI